VEDSFTVGKIASDKKWGLRSWKALDFKKYGLEPRSLAEVYAYATARLLLSLLDCLRELTFTFTLTIIIADRAVTVFWCS